MADTCPGTGSLKPPSGQHCWATLADPSQQVCTFCSARRQKPAAAPKEGAPPRIDERPLTQPPANPGFANPAVLARNRTGLKRGELSHREHADRIALSKWRHQPLTRDEVVRLYGWAAALERWPDP